MSGWQTYGRDCSRIEDKEKRITCEQNSEKRTKLISGIRSAIAAGKTVAVLGSGDLLIYGGPYRWYLQEFADVNPRVIPGVSCFNAANAALRKDVASGKETHAVPNPYRGCCLCRVQGKRKGDQCEIEYNSGVGRR